MMTHTTTPCLAAHKFERFCSTRGVLCSALKKGRALQEDLSQSRFVDEKPRRPLPLSAATLTSPPRTATAPPARAPLPDLDHIDHDHHRDGRASIDAAVSTSAPASIVPPATTAAAAAAQRASKWAIDPNEQLTSTWEHRLWTAGSAGIMAAVLANGVSQVHSPQDAAATAAAVLAAYVLSDLGTGIYHWSVDNYGDGTTPLVGRQIAAFQGHHQKPWTITKREFCNNVHQVFKPAAVPATMLLALSFVTPCWWNGFSSVFLFLICMSQQFHAWSHMKKSQLPGIVLALQDAGLLISRKAHGAHHRSPFEGNYCIVSGLWNTTLDDSGFLRALETRIAAATGVEPRCWHEPEYEYEELEATTMET